MNFEASNGKSAQLVEWNANNIFKSLKDMEPKSTMDNISTIDPTVIALASEAIQKGTTVAAAKPRKKTMTSLYLRYFETAPDGKTRSCKFCKQSYSIATATGNLGRHLSHRHPGYDKMSDVITNANPVQQPITVIKKHQSPAKPVSMDLDHLNWLLLKWLIGASHPPGTLENEGLANSFKFANSLVKIWSIERFQAIILEVYRSMREDVRTSLEQNAFQACHTLNKEDLDGRKTGSFCYIPCAARTLNVIIEDGLRTAKPVISKIREFALVMNASTEISDDFRQITAACQEGSWKFPIDASNRWSGSYTMLDIMRKASKSIDAVIRKHAETLASRNVLLSPTERNAVNIMHSYLEPFYKTTNNICTSKVPTIGLVLFFMDHVVEMINSCRDSRQSPDWLKSAADDMSKTARTYNSQVYNVFTYMAAILDPRIKSELVPENLNSESNLEDARSHFLRNYSSSHFAAMANGYTIQENEDGGSISFAEEIARKRRRISMSTTTDELTQYLSESPAPFTTDVLEWWKGNTTRYPRLSVMARDFLAMQATSVSPDELFCGKGDEIDKQRICLPHASMQAILCTRSWTDSGFKVRYRSTEIDYERLMESTSAVTDNGNVLSEDKAK
ncbi:Zinc finger bed domain-containing protein daysleeper [Thalictrum thalictroides]|uniref:Zinc finger bed domain-containing protein daysleeper n=1 Tax=Thalictrum thalictroides TaxID=46969 RepID=A0A7J6X7L8_THATH|nr:Zinc finger bed domain-containing protein daysleeper [Thalictrum thalictroides]